MNFVKKKTSQTNEPKRAFRAKTSKKNEFHHLFSCTTALHELKKKESHCYPYIVF